MEIDQKKVEVKEILLVKQSSMTQETASHLAAMEKCVVVLLPDINDLRSIDLVDLEAIVAKIKEEKAKK